jgi:hypothetical protein
MKKCCQCGHPERVHTLYGPGLYCTDHIGVKNMECKCVSYKPTPLSKDDIEDDPKP